MQRLIAGLTVLALLEFNVTSANADPVILTNAIRTLTLDGPGNSAPMNVTYDPVFNQYYGAEGGYNNSSSFVWSSNGTLLQNSTINLDSRALNYNANTGQIEDVTFAAALGLPNEYGSFNVGLTAGGLYTGTSTQLLGSLPGLGGDYESMPAYDAVNNVLYSRQGYSGTINVVSDATGAQLGTINLAVPGGINLDYETLGFDSFFDVFVTLDSQLDQALIFNSNGAYLGSSNLPGLVSPPYNYGMGYANGQLFAYDFSTDSWNGYQIFQPAATPEPATLILLATGFLTFGSLRILRRRLAWA